MAQVKNKKPLLKKILMVLFIFTAVMIIFALISDPDSDYRGVSYSSYSTKDDGARAFYLSLQEYGRKLGYNTEIHTKYARYLPDDSVAISVLPEKRVINADYEVNAIEEWIRKGNVYIVFADYDLIINSGKGANEINGKMKIFNIGKGRLIINPDYKSVLNKNIKSDPGYAARMMVMIADFNKKNVVINEFHHEIQRGTILRDIFGPGLYLFIIEIFVALALFFLHISDRLGAPAIITGTIKRQENENVYALAGIYERTKSLNIVLDVNMESFIQDLSLSLGFTKNMNVSDDVILESAEKDRRLSELGIRDITECCRMYKSGFYFSSRDIRQLINKIETIRKEL